jgi:hypothetical protein
MPNSLSGLIPISLRIVIFPSGGPIRFGTDTRSETRERFARGQATWRIDAIIRRDQGKVASGRFRRMTEIASFPPEILRFAPGVASTTKRKQPSL